MRWVQQFRALGSALLDVLRAEVEAFREEVQRSGRHLGVGLGFFAGAAMVAFWMLGALIFALGAILAIWLKVWVAALAVVFLFLLAALLLAGLGLRHLRQVDNPVGRLRERVDDHLDWWQNTLLREETAETAETPEILEIEDNGDDER